MSIVAAPTTHRLFYQLSCLNYNCGGATTRNAAGDLRPVFSVRTGGQIKTNRCSVCHHPQRLELEQAYIGGATLRALADQYDRNKSTIHTHLTHHVPASVEKAAEAATGREIEAGDRSRAMGSGLHSACVSPLLYQSQDC